MGIFDGLFGKKGPTVYMEAPKDSGSGGAVSTMPSVEGSVQPVAPQAPAQAEVAAQPVNPASLAEGGFVQSSAPEAQIPVMPPVQEAQATTTLETQSAPTMTVEGLGPESTTDAVDYKPSPFATEANAQPSVVESPVPATVLPVEGVAPAALSPDVKLVGTEGVATSFVPPVVQSAPQETQSPVVSAPEGLGLGVQEVVETPATQLNPQEGLNNVFNPEGVISQTPEGTNQMVASESTIAAAPAPEIPLSQGVPTMEVPQATPALETPQPVNLAPTAPQEKVG